MLRNGTGPIAAAMLLTAVSVAASVGPLSASPEHAGNAEYANEDSVPVRGVIKALDEASLSTELSARVVKIGFREGEPFKKGELLIAFDCERYRAEQQSADAVAREMRTSLESNQQLEKFSAVGKHDVEISRARLDKAEAEARALKARLNQCDIIAPYDGRVAELAVNLYEWPQSGKPFLKIVSRARLEIEIIVPSRWLSWLATGAELSFNVDETGRDYQAKVVRLGAAVDAVSQMVKVFAVFADPVGEVLPGMSGTAHFVRPNG